MAGEYSFGEALLPFASFAAPQQQALGQPITFAPPPPPNTLFTGDEKSFDQMGVKAPEGKSGEEKGKKSDKEKRNRKAWQQVMEAVAAAAGDPSKGAGGDQTMGGHTAGSGNQMDPSAAWAALHGAPVSWVKIPSLGAALSGMR